MEPRLTDINENEALQYLGYPGGALPQDVQDALTWAKEEILRASHPRAVWRLFDRNPDGTLGNTGFCPGGDDVKKLLQDCRKAILFGATLGAEVESLLRQAQVRNMADAVMLDACASAAVENVCDNLCADLEMELTGFLTDRFSPGYGDLPFSQQSDFCRILDLPRRIGVTLSPGGLMIPQKSVTAVLGVADRPQAKRSRGCAYCSSACPFRKEMYCCGKS